MPFTVGLFSCTFTDIMTGESIVVSTVLAVRVAEYFGVGGGVVSPVTVTFTIFDFTVVVLFGVYSA